MERSQFLFVDLQELTPGKPFPGFAVGSFIDGALGRGIKLKASDLQSFLENTLTMIKDFKDRKMPGLPIDASSHDKGDAAGWIVGAELGEVTNSEGEAIPTIDLSVDWTKIGTEKISEKTQANFSPTIDLKNKVIVGGSLTNWPASVDANGVPLFTAIELSQGIRYLSQPATEEETAASDDPPKWYNKLKIDLQEFVSTNINPQVEAPDIINEGDGQMTIELTQEQLDETIKTAVATAVADSEKGKVDLSELATAFNLNTGDAANLEVKHLEGLAEQVRERANLQWKQQLSVMERENRYAELSARVTGGSVDTPRGIPGADAEKIKAELMKLEPESAKFWGGLLEATVKNGLNDFAELGHGHKEKTLHKVSEEYVSELTRIIKEGVNPQKFFDAVGLGNATDYDLSEFEGAKS